MLVFSNALSQYGNYIRENAPVVIVGKLSMRDDKDPQIIVNRACPISDYTEQNRLLEQMSGPSVQKEGTLYLRLPTEEGTLFGKIRAILGMFPGESSVVVFFADTKQRRGSRCALDSRMLQELEDVLGKENVVIK